MSVSRRPRNRGVAGGMGPAVSGATPPRGRKADRHAHQVHHRGHPQQLDRPGPRRPGPDDRAGRGDRRRAGAVGRRQRSQHRPRLPAADGDDPAGRQRHLQQLRVAAARADLRADRPGAMSATVLSPITRDMPFFGTAAAKAPASTPASASTWRCRARPATATSSIDTDATATPGCWAPARWPASACGRTARRCCRAAPPTSWPSPLATSPIAGPTC